MAAISAESEQPITVIAMEGFRASHVDLGWLSEEILDHVLTIERLAALIGEGDRRFQVGSGRAQVRASVVVVRKQGIEGIFTAVDACQAFAQILWCAVE